MPLHSDIVGVTSRTGTFRVEKRHCMAYAAATYDRNPRYFDDTRPGGVTAPPLMGVRLDWHLRMFRAGEYGLTAADTARGVHATHDMIFHRLIRPGDFLTTSGQIVLAEQRPPGSYVLSRFDTIDEQGAPVLTLFYGSLLRGVPLVGTATSLAERLPPPLQAPAREGDASASWQRAVLIPEEMPHLYTEAADIWNPIHTERSVALAAGLPDIILHGTATLALAAREVVNHCAGGDPARLARISCRFGAMVLLNTAVSVQGTAAVSGNGSHAAAFSVSTAEGGPAIRDGIAVLR